MVVRQSIDPRATGARSETRFATCLVLIDGRGSMALSLFHDETTARLIGGLVRWQLKRSGWTADDESSPAG